MKKDGHHYKHFIFCDVKSSNQGARMLASAFMSSGYELGYYANAKGMAEEQPVAKGVSTEEAQPEEVQPSAAEIAEWEEDDDGNFVQKGK